MRLALVALALAACGRHDPCAHRSSATTCLVWRVVGDTPNGELGFRFGDTVDGDIVAGGRYAGSGYAALWHDGKLVRRWPGDEQHSLFGEDVVEVPGVGVVVGAPQAMHERGVAGVVDAYAASGERRWRAIGERGDGIGWSVARAGDVDGDGIEDVWAGAPSNPAHGRVYLLSGRDGHVIRTIDGSHPNDEFGFYVVSIDDVDGDGRRDVAIGAPGANEVVVASSATGAVVQTIRGADAGARIGEMIAALDDLDGDGAPELAIGAPDRGRGEVVIVSSRTGKVVRRIFGQHDGEMFGRMVATLDDLDGDGVRDLAIGAPSYASADGLQHGRVEVRSAKTLRVLADVRGTAAESGIGWHIARATTADGTKAMLVSAIRAEGGAGVLEVHAFE